MIVKQLSIYLPRIGCVRHQQVSSKYNIIALDIYTIGDLANAPRGLLKYKLGKNGLMLQDYANGLDRAPVKPTTLEESIGSVGNSITPPHDIRTAEDARCIYYLLAELNIAKVDPKDDHTIHPVPCFSG